MPESFASQPAPTSPGESARPTPAQAAAFAALLEPVLAPLLKTAVYLTRNQEDAEDLVQETVLQALRSFSQFEPGTNFKAWLFKIQHNRFINRLRSEARRPQSVQLEDEESVDNLSLYERTRACGLHRGGGDPAAKFLDKLDNAAIGEALRGLPDEYRAVATLYFIEELSYEQIAGIVDCPLNTVRSRLHRSRRLLQKALWDIATERGIVSGTPGNEGGDSGRRKQR